MIFTYIQIKNWYGFKDSELDLSYPRKLVDSNIPYEYLEDFENIRFKRAILLSGANASGKTSFTKILLSIRNFIAKKELNSYFYEGWNQDKGDLSFKVEFIDQNPEITDSDCFSQNTNKKLYNFYNQLEVVVRKQIDSREAHDNLEYFVCYKGLEIKKSDSVESLRATLEKLTNESDSKPKSRKAIIIDYINHKENLDHYIKQILAFQKLKFTKHWHFLCDDINDTSRESSNIVLNKDILEAVLQTFDPSIQSVQDSYFRQGEENKKNGFFVNFYNGTQIYISSKGEVNSNKHMLSLGTYKSIDIAYFISIVLELKDKRGATFFLDEGMPHVQSEIEKNIVALIIHQMNRYSQFFYTTHNYDILEMSLPTHSYLFLRKDENYNSEFIRAEQEFKKNDRSIINAVRNNILGTLPDTQLLDTILTQE